MRSRVPAVAIVDAAYRMTADAADWLGGLAAAARTFESGRGAYAVLQRVGGYDGAHPLVVNSAEWFADARSRALVYELYARTPTVAVERFMLGPMCIVGSFVSQLEASGVPAGALGDWARPQFDVADILGLQCHDGEAAQVALAFPSAVRLRPLRREITALTRVATHLGTALRLRRRVAAGTLPEAIFTPRGRVLHAEGDARAALAAIRLGHTRREHARSHGDLSLWGALVAGRWSLADRVSRDGQRFVVAYPNPLASWDPKRLGPREAAVVRWAVSGASAKEIGYALGIAAGTVATHLARAMRKLGAATRGDLATLVEALATHRASEAALVPLVAHPPAHPTLGAAEREVAAGVLAGLSNAAIARARGTSPATVSNQLVAIYRKLGVGSRAELIARLVGGSGE